MTLRQAIYNSRFFGALKIQKLRDEWVINKIRGLDESARLIDAGCGSQRYRKYCSHVLYTGQDIAEYSMDSNTTIEASIGSQDGYEFGSLDIISDINEIPVKDESFDAVLCTEVFEHAADPVRAINEFHRILIKGGSLILTVPSSTIRHMDPYYYYSGFSDNWLRHHLKDKFEIIELLPVADYYRVIAIELARIMSTHSIFSKIALAIPFLYLMAKRKTPKSIATQCYGYHILAKKI